jgi:phosphatidylserine decarboxylase
MLTKDLEEHSEDLPLLDPSSSNATVGSITISCYIEDPVETEQSFARRVLAIVDYDENGTLSLSEFSDLMKAFGNKLAVAKIEELFRQADTNGDGIVDIDELAALLADQQEKEPLISNCPVCGEDLGKYDKINDMIHMTLCFDEGTGNQIMTGGFLTDKQTSYGWMFKLSEWAHFSTYDVGLHSGSTASHILVFDRRTKRIVEEVIDGKIVLSMRALYQSKVGLTLINTGVKDLLKNLSEKQGKKMNSPESAKDIPKFLELFKDQINMDEVNDPIESFKTFNEFFIRGLKPGARPIAYGDQDGIATCAADSRLMAFCSVDESTRLWIKGRKFSIEGLLGTSAHSNALRNGSLVIFRLAPQDYHRFHVPVSGTVEKFVEIPGCLYTVNPIAVNSKYCNVFTENKRAISIISTSEFGKVAFVAIGATMVGSITFLKNEGDYVHKGDEVCIHALPLVTL